MANNLPPPKIAIFRRVIWSAGRRKSLSVRSGGAGFDRFRFSAQNYPFDTSHLAVGERDQFLAAVGADPDHHQQAQLLLIQPHLQVNPVDPQIHVVDTGQLPLLK